MTATRYIATVTESSETDRVRITVVDQKLSKIVQDTFTSNAKVEQLKQLFITQYGSELMFIESPQTPPKPNPTHTDGD
jgi:hypothetical protein